MPYEQSPVDVGRTQEQIKKLLGRHNVVATRFTSFPAHALMEFVRKDPDTGRLIPYRVTVRPKAAGKQRAGSCTLDQAERQVWRVVYWWLKSKLEAIQFGLLEFEQEFLPYLLLDDGSGRRDTVDHIFFERLAGRLASSNDPFGGLRPALPSGEER